MLSCLLPRLAGVCLWAAMTVKKSLSPLRDHEKACAGEGNCKMLTRWRRVVVYGIAPEKKIVLQCPADWPSVKTNGEINWMQK